MNFEFFETLNPKPILKKEIILKGAGKENIIKAKIAEKVTIRIGPVVQKWDVVVGEIADSLLLGLDFLKFHNSIIDMEKMTLTLDQSIIPITKIKTKDCENVQVFRVSLRKELLFLLNQSNLHQFSLIDHLQVHYALTLTKIC